MTDTSLGVLHLTTELPTDVGVSGGSTRQFRLLAALAQQGHKVTVVSPVTPAQHRLAPESNLAAVGVRLIATPRRDRREREVVSGLRRRPSLAWRAAVMPFYAVQTALLALDMAPGIAEGLQARPDVVSIEHDIAVALSDGIPADLPRVLTAHNVTASYYAARSRSSAPLRRLLYRFESWRADRYITPRLSNFARLITVSEADARLLRARTRQPVAVVPNGTSLRPVVPQRAGTPIVLFTGTMSHPPNREGILWFHRHVWPEVRNACPDARLVVVGRHPSRDVAELAVRDATVQVTGGVPDMAPYFRDATIVIAPLLAGGGTRLKILDAFAAARAVVATTVAAEGLEVADGEHLVIADDPSTFAKATSELINNPALRQKLATEGRQLVEARYDWRILSTKLADILRSAIADE